MTTTSNHPPSVPRRALVFYLTASEEERFNLVMQGEPQKLAGLQNGALNVVRSLINAKLLKPVEGEDETYVIDPFVGHKVIRIGERSNYRLPKPKYDAIRYVQDTFIPDASAKLLRESKEQLQSFLDNWASEHGHEPADFQVGAWIMSGTISSQPSSGSGLVYFEKGDVIYYVTVPGLEAFKLEASDKERTRSTSKRASSKRDGAGSFNALTEPLEERLRHLRDEEGRLNKARAELEEKLGANKAQLEANADEQNRIKKSIEILKG